MGWEHKTNRQHGGEVKLKVWMLKSKIHRAKITGKNLDYEGSLTIDSEYMKKANMLPYERVEVYNISNGARFSTYLIPGEPGKGEVVLNGAASRLGEIGDQVIIASYALMDEEEAKNHRPQILRFDENGKIIE